MKRNILSVCLAALMLVAVPLAATADNNAVQEIDTAATHAQFAANAADTATALKHFHHVINCLVGPKGKQYDGDVGDPCQGMGNGALNDVAQNSTQHAKLQQALVLAEQALHADNLQATQQYAARISAVIKGAESAQ